MPDFGSFPDISIHAAREGGDIFAAGINVGRKISIHAAREGGDIFEAGINVGRKISIHAAVYGGHARNLIICGVERYFNPRRP